MSLYIGINNVARNAKNIYVGVNGVARKVTKAYIGVNGVARLFYPVGDYLTTEEGSTLTTETGTDLEVEIGLYIAENGDFIVTQDELNWEVE